MNTVRMWIILSWILLPAVMGGGSLLLRRLTVGDPTPFQVTWIRAFHAHGGVLIIMSLLYYMFLDRTSLSGSVKRGACLALFLGIAALAGGFFVHALIGQPHHTSIGTALTLSGAASMAAALLVLVYGLLTTPAAASDTAKRGDYFAR
jgi:drug/metabolite transporter superfamily protein YnfA